MSESRWPSWAAVPSKSTVSVDVKRHSTNNDFYLFEFSGAEGGRELAPDVFPVVIFQLQECFAPRLVVHHWLALKEVNIWIL